jgi:hypothetical protein
MTLGGIAICFSTLVVVSIFTYIALLVKNAKQADADIKQVRMAIDGEKKKVDDSSLSDLVDASNKRNGIS